MHIKVNGINTFTVWIKSKMEKSLKGYLFMNAKLWGSE
jgi:hypothetical protein